VTKREEFLLAALWDIQQFGKRNTGYGYSCSKKAEQALKQVNDVKE
jgi:hypothetical protein